MAIKSLNSVASAGTIIISLDDDCPSGYFKLDGSTGSLDKATFSDLWNNLKHLSIMVPYAATSFFVLPNFSGRFLRQSGMVNVRNWSNGGYSGSISSEFIPVGTFQEDSIRNITGQGGAKDDQMTAYLGGAFYYAGRADYDARSGGGSGWWIGFDSNRVVPTSMENRPLSVAVNYFIKY